MKLKDFLYLISRLTIKLLLPGDCITATRIEIWDQ